MAREIFGTDGIRGQAYVYPLDERGSKQVGIAVAKYFAKKGETILVGRDPRQSSIMLETGIIEGIVSQGVSVISIGIVPTAGLAYLTRKSNAKAGVMITASHNPYTDNGIKVFSAEGTKLTDDTEKSINRLIETTHSEPGGGSSSEQPELIEEYIDFLVGQVGNKEEISKLSVVIDCANGATSTVAPEVFKRLGITTHVLFDAPDGVNINEHCGATDTMAVAEYVKDHSITAGVAFDGDGDRAMFIDETGRLMNGDYSLYILAVSRNEPGVVATIMSNMGLEKAIVERGARFIRTNVGDRYVVDGLNEADLNLGGEQSGHVVMRELSPTGDGIQTALQLLSIVASGIKSLAAWRDELILMPQTLLNVAVPDKTIIDDPYIKSYIKAQQVALGETGRISVRASGTEPLVRIMVEADNAHEISTRLADEINKQIANQATEI
jgi:phosphoglucosamine mutase